MSRPVSQASATSDGPTLATTDEDGHRGFVPVPDFHERPSGSRLGRYTLLEPVGRGGMGIVYAAYDPQLDRRIALKVIRPRRGQAPRPRDRARLEREAQAMARLAHPNVIAVHDVAESDGELFLAMEFVDGPTLHEWLDLRRHTWSEIVDVFVAAGEGLAAAHAAGLIHRDFKPDNVLIGADGRVRVTDFGLARADDASAIGGPPEGPEPGASTSVAQRITHAGALLGTPAYMSPEQHAHAELDDRTDQFSFCVALFEGLFAVHPFEGDTVGELSASVTMGRLRELPRDTDVPAKLRRAVIRGLSKAREDRFASMSELLDELRFDPGRRRRTIGLGIAGVAIALVAGGAVYAATRHDVGVDPERCLHAGQAVDAHWGDTQHASMRDAFVRTGRAGADDSFERTAVVLDDWASSWRLESTAACEATHVQGVQSEEMLDRRSECLSRRLGEVDALLRVFADADAALVADATEVAGRLASPHACADTQHLGEVDPLPSDPEQRARVQQLQVEFDELYALSLAGRGDEGLDRAEQLIEQARVLGHLPSLARARWLAGAAHADAGDYERAHAYYQQAALDAANGHDDVRLMQALLDRLDLLSRVEQRYEEALSLATTLEVVIARNGHPSAEALQLHVRVGSAQLGLGHYDEARAEYVAAQARLDETSQLEVRATIHNNLGAVDFSQGRFPRARQQFELALELRAGFQGELHTDYATGLLNVGNVLLTTGDIDGGIERYAHALAIFDAIDDADTPEAAGVHNSLAVAYYSKGRFDLAREQAQRALDAYDAHLGADAPARAGPAIMLAQLDALDGETDRARTRLSDLVDAMTRALGSNHPNTALPTAGLGRLEREAGDLGAARPHLERALELLHPLGDAHPWLLAVSTDLALLELAEGHRTEAQRHAERALRIGDAGQEDRQELGRALYAAAMVHRDTDLDAAGRYARRGLDTLRANGGRPAWILAQLQEIVRAAGADGAIDDE